MAAVLVAGAVAVLGLVPLGGVYGMGMGFVSSALLLCAADWRARRRGRTRLCVAADAFGFDEDRHSALLAHHAVVGVPVVVGAARAGEHRPQQQP